MLHNRVIVHTSDVLLNRNASRGSNCCIASFRVPKHVYEGLQDKAKKMNVSISDLLNYVLAGAFSHYAFVDYEE